MSVVQLIDKISAMVRKPENVIKRDYQTIGGMWTVDTWREPSMDVTVRLGSEGYETTIIAHDLHVTYTYRGSANEDDNVVFTKGNQEDLWFIVNHLK